MNADDKFIKKIRDCFEYENYDNLDMDEWEIIETLLDICDARSKEKAELSCCCYSPMYDNICSKCGGERNE